MKAKIIFLGTTEFASYQLQALHESSIYEIVMVVSQPDRKAGRSMKLQESVVKQYAIKNNLPIITPEKMNSALDEIKNLKAEAAVVVAYGQILSQNFLDLFPQKVVNLHASLLPRWRGAAPIQRAIMAGDTKTGLSLQVMVKDLDAGDIIGEEKVEIEKNLSSVELHEKLKILGPQLLLKNFKDYLESKEKTKLLQIQNKDLITYAHKIEKSEQKINWNQSATNIHNFIRGLALNRGAVCNFKTAEGQVIVCKVHKTEVLETNNFLEKNTNTETTFKKPSKNTSGKTESTSKNRAGSTPGSTVKLDSNYFVIACGPNQDNLSYLKILQLQLPSRPKIQSKDFLNLNLINLKTNFF